MFSLLLERRTWSHSPIGELCLSNALLWRLPSVAGGSSDSLCLRHSPRAALDYYEVCLLASPLPLQLVSLRPPLRCPEPSDSFFFFLVQTNPVILWDIVLYLTTKVKNIAYFFKTKIVTEFFHPVSGEGTMYHF